MADEVAALLKQAYGPEPAREKRAEVKPYEFPWYDRMYHRLTNAAFGDYANARDLDTTKRWTNAALAAWPGLGQIAGRIPAMYSYPSIAIAGGARPLQDWMNRSAPIGVIAEAFRDFAEPITNKADPERKFEPGPRESKNTRTGSDTKFTQKDWETAMYGQEGEPGFDTAMLAGPRERTPHYVKLDDVLRDSEYATPKYPTRAEGGAVDEPPAYPYGRPRFPNPDPRAYLDRGTLRRYANEPDGPRAQESFWSMLPWALMAIAPRDNVNAKMLDAKAVFDNGKFKFDRGVAGGQPDAEIALTRDVFSPRSYIDSSTDLVSQAGGALRNAARPSAGPFETAWPANKPRYETIPGGKRAVGGPVLDPLIAGILARYYGDDNG